MGYNEYLAINPFGLGKEEKRRLLSKRIGELTVHHMRSCREYRNMLHSAGFTEEMARRMDGEELSYEDVPFLPVRLFKEMTLKSVGDADIIKTMTSSGTTGQAVSRIYLDKSTSSNQQKVMVNVVSEFTGTGRMPMLILDCPSVLKDRKVFSARGAGVLGFSVFGREKCYCLKDGDMSLDTDTICKFLEKHQGEKFLLFGFTFMVWQHFYKELVRLKQEGLSLDLSKGILIHGGGWKKLANEAVSPLDFKEALGDVCGLVHIHDYYGMAEQTGCIYMECEYGHFHASVFSDVITRRAIDFSICGFGERGIIEVVSSIPESYPGHCLLTEDVGEILGEDDCPCGRKGKYFRVKGRLKNAEIRGCSDTYGERFGA